MMRIEKTKKGFTLIELLVVVAIIGILAAIAIPQFAKYRTRAYNSAAQSDLRSIQTSIEGFYADTQEYPTVTQTDQKVTLTGTSVTDDNLTLSLNVGVTDFVAAVGQTYSLATKHENGGDRCYGVADNHPSIVETDKELAKDATAAAGCTTDPAD